MKSTIRISLIVSLLWVICIGVLPQATAEEVNIIFAAYTVPKEAYQRAIIPAFKKYWKEKTRQDVTFQESYEASGAQSRAIAAGLEADIAALSLEKDISRLKDAGLITHEWKNNKYNGFVTRSLTVIAYRQGNPKNIKSWDDLTRQDVDVIYPSPKTSGGAMWFVNAIYGAGLKLSEVKNGKKDPQAARQLLKFIQKRVKVMDKSGRASVTTFENGVGDVLLTYEDEALLRQQQGKDFPFIIPDATILIENPIALIDKNADKHKTRKVAEAFIEFVHTRSAQRSFAQYGLRPVDADAEAEFREKFPVPPQLFDAAYLGGWDQVEKQIYGKNGVWTQIVEELARDK
jgi:sulfate transport system substrate-binding protein